MSIATSRAFGTISHRSRNFLASRTEVAVIRPVIIEARNQTGFDGVIAGIEQDWDCGTGGLRCQRTDFATAGENNPRPPLNKLGGQRLQPVVFAARPSVFDRHVLAIDEAGIVQASSKPFDDVPEGFG